MTIYIKTKGWDNFFKCKIWFRKSNKGYWIADSTDKEEISKYCFYKQNKDNRYIIDTFKIHNNSIHQIGNENFFKKLLDNTSQTC